MALLFFLLGIFLLYLGSEWLVKSSNILALKLGIKPFIIGVTVVAFGTSSPELLVSLQAGFLGVGDMAIGNVVGSNICNIALILGTAAVIRPMSISRDLMRFDIPVMLAVSLLIFYVTRNGVIGFSDGLLLSGLLLAFIIVSVIRGVREHQSFVSDEEMQAKTEKVGRNSFLVLAGLFTLAIGAWLFVDGAIGIARFLGVNEAIIGLTVVALGTSVPELASSIIASRRGHSEFIVGNVIGSNIFNILCILGITALIVPLDMGNVTDTDLYIMVLFAIMIVPFSVFKCSLNRVWGSFFLLFYAMYVGYLIY